jgi:hypothetical protein
LARSKECSRISLVRRHHPNKQKIPEFWVYFFSVDN